MKNSCLLDTNRRVAATVAALLALGGALAGASEIVQLDLGKGVSMPLAQIPSGTFLMGSSTDDPTAANDESDRAKKGVQHKVTISKDFLIGVTEVTQDQYEAVTGKNPSSFKGGKQPVDSVSWDDAALFCKLLSEKSGKTVRLPTEAEWEYACRAGASTRFPFGDSPEWRELGEFAWYQANSDRATHPVASKKPNAWGLHDMGGNVWEWCQDVYTGPYEDQSVTDPRGKPGGTLKVLRGGCWESGPSSCRSANRGGIVPSRATSRFGFRVVVEK